MVSETPKDLLRQELSGRKKKNQAYSLRSFARALEVSPGYLSLVLNGHKNLTAGTATSLVRKINWSAGHKKYFLTLVELENSTKEKDRAGLMLEVNRLKKQICKVPTLELDHFKMISDWTHTALLTLLTLPKIKKTSLALSKRLQISLTVCEANLDRLERLNLVVKNPSGCWEPTHDRLHVETTPSEAIRYYHKEMLRKALVAIDQQSFDSKFFNTMTLTLDPTQLPEAKKKIQAFQEEIAQNLEGQEPSQVYQFSSLLFRIDQDSGDPL